MKPKKRPKALRWTDFGRHEVSIEAEGIDADQLYVLFTSNESKRTTVKTKSQCRKLIAWLEKAKEFLK